MAVIARRRESRLRASQFHLSPDTWALLSIALAVVLANLPYLLGVFDPNPFDHRSGLISQMTPGLLSGKPTIDPSNGFTSQAIGHLAALDLLHLRLPWWNPYEGTGMPLLGETQSAALFPPTLLTAFSNGQLYEHILLELVAGICTYRLLRHLIVTRPAAIAAGIAFALNGKFAWFADATVNPLPFLPMLLLGIERAFDATRTGARGGWRLLAVAGAGSVYAGFPEVAYIDALMAVCWVGWRAGCLERGQLRRFAAKVALGALAGTLLAAPMLLAMAEYLSHADLGAHTGTQFGRAHLPLFTVPQLLLPYVYGQINAAPHAQIWVRVGGYLSAALLLFAVLGLLAPGRRGLKLVLFGWALLVFARTYGQPPLLGHVLGALPGMWRVQFFRYGTAALELPVILLAGLGLDDLTRVIAHRPRLLWGAVAAIGAVIGAALYARPIVHSLGTRFQHVAFFHASVVWAILIAVLAGVVGLIRQARVRGGLLAVLVAVDTLVLFAVPEFAAPRVTRVDLAPVAYLRQHLGEARFFTLGPIEPDYGSYFGFASLGIDDFPPKAYARYIHARVDPVVAFTGFRPKGHSAEWELIHHLRGYRSAGVRYVLTPGRQTLPQTPSTFRLVLHSPSTRIYRLNGSTPYYQATRCRVTSSARATAQVVCPRQATLVRHETWFAGWRAFLDGRPTVIRRVDGLYQGITIPAGRHRVTFDFVPPGMSWAALGLLGGCVLLFIPTVSGRLAKRR